MGRPLRDRIQDKLADRFNGVNYPKQTYVPARASAASIGYRNTMPLHQRAVILLGGLLALAIAIPVGALALLVLWHLARAILGIH